MPLTLAQPAEQKPRVGATLDRTHPLTADLLWALPFNEGSNQIVNHARRARSGTHAISGGTPTWASDRYGQYIHLTSGILVTLAAASIPSDLQFGSFSAFWIGRPAAVTNNMTSEVSNGGPQLGVNGSGNLFLNRQSVASVSASTSTVSTSVFHVGGVVYDIVAGTCKWWINGRLDRLQTGVSTTAFTWTSNDFRLGHAATGNWDLAAFYLWNRTLADADMEQLYETPYAIWAPPTYKRWFFGEASATMSITSPARLVANATGATVVVQGSGTAWVNGSTTFSVSGVTGAAVTATSIDNGTQVATLTVTASTGGNTGTLTFSNSADSATATLEVIAAATAITLTGPQVGRIGQASGAWTVAVTPSGAGVASAVTVTTAITPDGSTSANVTLNANTPDPTGTFTVTPTATGSHTVSITNDGGLSGTSSTYTAFDPTAPSLTGLELYLSGDALAGSDSDAVSSWTDTGGSSRHATQATGSLRPSLRTGANGINGHPCIQTDGSDILVTPSMFGAGYDTAFSLYLVMQRASGTSSATVLGTASNTLLLAEREEYSVQTRLVTGEQNRALTATEGNITVDNSGMKTVQAIGDGAIVYALTYDGSDFVIEANGLEAQSLNLDASASFTTTASGNMGLTGALTIGARADGTSGGAWKIAHVAICSAGHSRAERQAETLRLRQLYGVMLQRIVWQIGDSTTYGAQTSNIPVTGPPGFTPDYLSTPAAAINLGINSSTSVEWQDGADGYFARCIEGMHVSDRTDIISINLGTNADIVEGDAVTIANIWDFCARLRAADWDKVVIVVAPIATATVKAAERADWASHADALCDLQLHPAFDYQPSQNADRTNLTYFQADTIHLTDEGSRVWGELIADTINALLASSGGTTRRRGRNLLLGRFGFRL
jgi:lysophospholipase L1-like esterase